VLVERRVASQVVEPVVQLCALFVHRVPAADRYHVDAVRVADELVVGRQVRLVSGKLPETHAAGTCSIRQPQTHARTEGWRRGAVVSGVRRMNEVNARRARLVPGWVTVFGRVYHLGM